MTVLVVVFGAAAAMMVVGAIASAFAGRPVRPRGGRRMSAHR